MLDKPEQSCHHVIAVLTRQTGSMLHRGQAVTHHLQDCPYCAQWERTLRFALALFGTAADVGVPPSLQRRLEEEIW